MLVDCKFFTFTWFGTYDHYTCKVSDKKIPEGTELEFYGQHKEGKSNSDVTAIYFGNCEIPKVPQGLTKIFPHLEVLNIDYSGLKSLTREDLAEYKNLKILYFNRNLLEHLPGDLFQDFRNLEVISFPDNKLTLIEPEILDGLRGSKLKEVNFADNPNYDKRYSKLRPKEANATLSKVKDELVQKYQEHLKLLIEEQKARVKDLETEIKQLKDKMDNGLYQNFHKLIQQDEFFKDLTVIIGESQFRVHKWLLAARSPTLAEMLTDTSAENLKLESINKEVFEKILKYMYKDELPRDQDETDFFELFAASGKLKIEELKEFAALKLLGMVDGDNALRILSISNKYGHEQLKQRAFEVIKNHHPEIKFGDELIEDSCKVATAIQLFRSKEEKIRKAKRIMEEETRKANEMYEQGLASI